ncbi:hypothetical protein ES705_15522 [subsurface metagenome]
MSEITEIIYNFDGYKTIIKKEGEEKMEEYKLKNLNGADAKRILETADQENIDIEAIIDFIKKLKGVKKMSNEKTNDEKRFTEEEKKVQEFMAKPINKGVSYRQAVLTVLDKSEPEVKKEFTEEEKQFIEKQEGDFKKVEEYLESHPKTEYREAVKIVLNKDELNENEKKVEEYIEKCKSQGIEITYRQAVLKVLDRSEPEPKKEE